MVAGMDDHISKPINIPELVALLERYYKKLETQKAEM
jgi:CheY-like chemotaxis protein